MGQNKKVFKIEFIEGAELSLYYSRFNLFFDQVEDLPIEDLESRMRVVSDLWEKGILITLLPLDSKYDDP